MKKGLSAILLVIYFIVSTGFTVNLHYCMDQFHSWEFGAAEDDRCDQCGMDTGKSGCCHDEVKTIKLQQDVFQGKALAYHFALPVLIGYTSTYLLLPFQNAVSTKHYFSHSPPLLSKQETYLENCVFRI